MHPRNRHGARYDFPQLVAQSPELARFVCANPAGDSSIDFADPASVTALNRAILRAYYGIDSWELPPGYLCPPIPGRADYIHHLADLLAESNGGSVPCGKSVTIFDVGVGANCIYPIIGTKEYGWRFVGSDIDPAALRAAQKTVDANASLHRSIELRLQPNSVSVFDGIVRSGEHFYAAICNPPFHASAAAAASGTRRKLRNLGLAQSSKEPVLNFGGQSSELWCRGGEAAIIRRMISESVRHRDAFLWFTTLVSNRDNLPGIYATIKAAKAVDVRTIAMSQGQKQSRIVAWTFLDRVRHESWRAAR
jgi:23S rRNA (adenine1618-N6)-methyltransferase